jgi:hypothetical protein
MLQCGGLLVREAGLLALALPRLAVAVVGRRDASCLELKGKTRIGLTAKLVSIPQKQAIDSA